MKMYKSFFVYLAVLCGLLFNVHSHAADRTENINTILDKTGFDELVQHVPDFAQSILKQSSGALEPQVNSQMSAAFKYAFAAPQVRSDIFKVINSHYKAEYADSYLEKLHSPLAEKVSQMERETNVPENRQAFMEFAQNLKTKPAPAKRQALIQRLDEATRVTDFGVDMQAAFFKAVFTAVNPVLDDDMRVGTEEMEKMVNEVRNSFSEAYKENTRASYLFALRDMTDEELDEYIKLCESDDYRWGIQVLGNAMVAALNQAADRAAKYMTQASQ